MVSCEDGGCELLKRYDADKDGIIRQSNLDAAQADWYADVITLYEFLFIVHCYNYFNGVINDKCPGCYTKTIKVTITANAKAKIYVNGKYETTLG